MGTVGRGLRVGLACSLVLVADGAALPRPRHPPPVAIATVERQVIADVNRHRLARGLPPLVAEGHIAREARRHSRAMAAGARGFGHVGFEGRVAALRGVTGCGEAAENVARQQGYGDAAAMAMAGWLDSPGHRRNIEGRYALTGVGVVSDGAGLLYLTQLFCGG